MPCMPPFSYLYSYLHRWWWAHLNECMRTRAGRKCVSGWVNNTFKIASRIKEPKEGRRMDYFHFPLGCSYPIKPTWTLGFKCIVKEMVSFFHSFAKVCLWKTLGLCTINLKRAFRPHSTHRPAPPLVPFSAETRIVDDVDKFMQFYAFLNPHTEPHFFISV